MGWARSLTLICSARLGEAEDALRQIRAIEQRLTEMNLFTFDPPGAGSTTNILELDGNTGVTAGIAEMLVQSHQDNIIHLLPALPKAWKDGKVSGLCARGGYEVEAEWHNGELAQAQIFSKNGGSCRVRYRNRLISLDIKAGETHSLDFGSFFDRQ
jgi:alpha-L-fucosidase 2